jgi:hypothetical protein
MLRLEVMVWLFPRRGMQMANDGRGGGAVNILEENDCDPTKQLARDLDTGDKTRMTVTTSKQ